MKVPYNPMLTLLVVLAINVTAFTQNKPVQKTGNVSVVDVEGQNVNITTDSN